MTFIARSFFTLFTKFILLGGYPEIMANTLFDELFYDIIGKRKNEYSRYYQKIFGYCESACVNAGGHLLVPLSLFRWRFVKSSQFLNRSTRLSDSMIIL